MKESVFIPGVSGVKKEEKIFCAIVLDGRLSKILKKEENNERETDELGHNLKKADEFSNKMMTVSNVEMANEFGHPMMMINNKVRYLLIIHRFRLLTSKDNKEMSL